VYSSCISSRHAHFFFLVGCDERIIKQLKLLRK
jgi:hypothetical protein